MGLAASTLRARRRRGTQAQHPAEAREPLLDLARPTVGTHSCFLFQEAQLEDFEILAAGAASQIVRCHELETELRFVVLLATSAD